eukprot:4391155-Prymnesium_polylepis.1
MLGMAMRRIYSRYSSDTAAIQHRYSRYSSDTVTPPDTPPYAGKYSAPPSLHTHSPSFLLTVPIQRRYSAIQQI